MTITDFIGVGETGRGNEIAAPIFRRKYGAEPPDFPYHVVSYWKRDDGSRVPVSYVHFWQRGRAILIGGACTDGDVIRRMGDAERAEIESSGGINLLATRYSLLRYGPLCDGIFGHCGDARSFGILMRCGFQPVRDPYLIAWWPRLLDARRRAELIDEVAAIGPF